MARESQGQGRRIDIELDPKAVFAFIDKFY